MIRLTVNLIYCFRLPERSSVGVKFFESYQHVSLMKRMKKRLDETSGYHHKLANVPPIIQSSDLSDDTVHLGVLEDHEADRRKDFHRGLVR